MELQHLIARLFVDGDLKLDPARCVPLFHSWVARQSLPETLIDVAELLHVPDGPGVIVVGHEADYALDHTGGRWGVLYRRKTTFDGTNAERIVQALNAAAAVAALIEAAFPGEFAVGRREFELIVNDRALASNTPEAFDAAKGDLEKGVREFLQNEAFQLEPQGGDPRRRFAVTVRTAKPFRIPSPAAA